jgi:hypothetical protein
VSESNFVAIVKAAGASDGFTHSVRVANPEDFANALPVAELPTAGEAYRDVLFRLTTDNNIYYLNESGDGWMQCIAIEQGDGEEGDKLAVFGGMWANTAYLPFGDQTVDGSWRIGMSGTALVFERRESGAWVEKARMQA